MYHQKSRQMVDNAERTWFCPQVETSHSDELFIDNSYSSNSGDNCVPDILGIRHVHEMNSNPALHAAKKLHVILGTVTECRGAGDSCSLSEVVGYAEEMDSLDYSASLISHKHKRKKKSKQLTKSDTLSDADEVDSLDSSMLVSSHKHKKKKKSRKFIHSDTLSNMDETKSLNCSVLVSSNKHGKHKRRKICETLSDVTRWVQDNVDGSNSPPQHIRVSVNSHKHKRKERKLTKCGVKQVVEGPDCSDSQSLIDLANSNKNTKKSRKFPQSDTAEETDSINFSDGQSQRVPVSVSSHKHKRTNTCQTLSDVTGWIQEDSINYNHSQSVIGSVSCPKSKKKSRKCPQSDTSPNMEELDNLDYNDSQLLVDSVTPPKSKKKSRKCPQSDTSPNMEELDNLDYNDSQLLVDSVTPPKSKKKSRKCHQSDTLSDVHESDSINCSDPHQPDVLALMSLHKRNRTKKSRRLAQFDTLSNVEEPDSVDCTDSHLASVSSRKHKKTKKSRKLPQSDILSDVTAWVQEADSIECNDTRSLTDSVTSPKNKSTKCAQSDTLPNVQEPDSVNCTDSHLQGMVALVSSHKHKRTKKSRKCAQSDILSDVTDWVQEPDSLTCSGSQSSHVLDPVTSLEKRKKKSKKFTKSDTLSNVEDTDGLPPASVSTHKHKRKNKSRNLAKPETMFEVMRCTDEDSSMDDSQSQQFLPFGSPPKASRKQKSKQPPDTKLTERTESSERMEQDKTAQHEITEGSPPMSDDEIYRKCNEMDQNGDRDEDSASARHSHAEPDHSDNDINSLSGAEDPASANDLHAEARTNDSVPARTACRTYRHALHRDGASQATSVLHSDSVTSEQRYTYLRRNRAANELEKPLLVQKLRDAADDDKVFADILHAYETNVSYEWFKDTAQLLQAEGLSANRKKWSVNEDKQLKANWESFHQEYPDAEVNKLLCCSKCSPDEKKAIGRMIIETQFYKKLGENIRRHLCQIYNRARAILIQQPKSQITKADDPRLVELFGRHGKKWALIAQEMGTTVRVVQRRWTSMQKPVTKGYWSMKEDNLLMEVVKEFVGDHYLDLDKSVSRWPEIAERMPGRDKEQCYTHWFGVIQPRLKWKVAGIKQPVLMGGRRVICDFTNRQLIECIYSFHVDCATKIDWTKVQQLVDKNLPLAIFRSRWMRMKSRVPGYKRKTFTEIMEHLLQARSAKR